MNVRDELRMVKHWFQRIDWHSQKRAYWEAVWRLRQILRMRSVVSTKQGVLELNPHDAIISFSLYVWGEFQLDTTERALTFLRERSLMPPKGKGLVVDIGANIGVIAIGLLYNDEVASAVCIEPDPTNFALLAGNISRNDLKGRAIAVQAAASDRAGELLFDASSGNFGDHFVVTKCSAETTTCIAVKAQRLDDILKEHGIESRDVSLVWIDVQGFETMVFGGGEDLFAKAIPVVAEVWPAGMERAGLAIVDFCQIASKYWDSFWVWRRSQQYVCYPIQELARFCEELGSRGEADDVIFTRERM